MPEPLTIPVTRFPYPAGVRAPIEEQIEQVCTQYTLKGSEAILEFLRERPGLSLLLLEAVAPLRGCFGTAPELQLKSLSDEESCSLSATVLWKGSLASARQCRDCFDTSWWLDHIGDADGDLVFDYEFV